MKMAHQTQEMFEVAERGECGWVEGGEGVAVNIRGTHMEKQPLGAAIWLPETATLQD